MVLTGRTGLIALLGVLPIALSPWPATTFVVLLLVLLLVVVIDVALAGSPRALGLTRAGDTSARLGQPVDAVLRVHNAGARRFRGALRDAWPPSACAEPRAHTLGVRADETVTVTTLLRPVRRGDLRSEGVTVRSIGPLGLAGRQGSHPSPDRYASCRRSCRVNICRPG